MNETETLPYVATPPAGEPFSVHETRRGQTWRNHAGRVISWLLCEQCGVWYESGLGQEFFTGHGDGKSLEFNRQRHQLCATCWIFYKKNCVTVKPKGPRPIEIKIPQEYTLASLDGITREWAVKAMRWPDSIKFLTIRGHTGSGKTHLCHALRRHLATRGLRTRYMSMPAARESWFSATQSEGREELINSWKNEPLIMLDEFNSGQPTAAWEALLLELLDYRLSNWLPTVIVLRMPEVSENIPELPFSPPIISRLKTFDPVALISKTGRSVDWRKAATKPVANNAKTLDNCDCEGTA